VTIPSLQPLASLQELAMFFHQDFDLLDGGDVRSSGAKLIKGMSAVQKQSLVPLLEAFLTQHEQSAEKGIRNAWLRCGAEYWPTRDDTKAILKGFLALAREPQKTKAPLTRPRGKARR
jgi:hypothetical protein